MAINFIQAQPFKLSGSGSSIGDTTLTLQSMVGIDGNNITTSDLGTNNYGTLEPGNGTQEEAFSFTGITQNANGTATLTGVSHLLFKQPYTASSGLQTTHAGASTVILSNDAAFYNNIISYVNTIAASGAVFASTSAIGIVQQATTAQINAAVPTGSSTGILFMSPDQFAASQYALATGTINALAGTSGTPSTSNLFVTQQSLKFGGTGADGALALSSGTSINLGGAQLVIKNYTSITGTGTSQLTFTNAHASGTYIVLKSQGNVTLTSSATPIIDARGMGATAGNSGFSLFGNPTLGLSGSAAATGGTAGSALSPTITTSNLFPKFVPFVIGAAGGNGGANNSGVSGTGAAGGGALYIECAGALNITGVLNTSGSAGAAGSGGSGASNAAGGGGGGAGSCVILYNTLTTNTGTYTVAGGAGGSASSGATGNGGGGGGGGGSIAAGTVGSAGTTNNSGTAGAGGPGGAAFSLVAKNTEFV